MNERAVVRLVELKTHPSIMREAGKIACMDGYSWVCAAGYAAAVVGTSEAYLVHAAMCQFLHGWIEAYEEDLPTTRKAPSWLKTLADSGPESVPMPPKGDAA